MIEVGIKDFDWTALENEQKQVLLKSGNPLIAKKYGDYKVWCHADYTESLYKQIMSMNIVPKDFENGDVVRVNDIIPIDGLRVILGLENGLNPIIELDKERKYCGIFSETAETMHEKLKNAEWKAEILNTEPYVILTGDANNPKADLYGGYVIKTQNDFMSEITKPVNAYVAKVLQRNRGGFLVDVCGIECFLPGGLAAANKIVNFDDYIGKEIPVMIEDYLKDGNIFIVSNKKYVTHILPSKIQELSLKQTYKGVVTGTTKFGVFLEWDDIYTGLLHTSKMKTETLKSFKEGGINPGDMVDFWILEISNDNKVILTEEDPETRDIEYLKFKEQYQGKILQCKALKKLKHIGFLFKVNDRVGLLYITELHKTNKTVNEGDTLDLFIKEVQKDKIILELPNENTEKLQ